MMGLEFLERRLGFFLLKMRISYRNKRTLKECCLLRSKREFDKLISNILHSKLKVTKYNQNQLQNSSLGFLKMTKSFTILRNLKAFSINGLGLGLSWTIKYTQA
jgi:hypothetical protein